MTTIATLIALFAVMLATLVLVGSVRIAVQRYGQLADLARLSDGFVDARISRVEFEVARTAEIVPLRKAANGLNLQPLHAAA